MRISNFVALAGALALPDFCNKAWADEIQSERAALEECGAYSQAGIRECLEKESRVIR